MKTRFGRLEGLCSNDDRQPEPETAAMVDKMEVLLKNSLRVREFFIMSILNVLIILSYIHISGAELVVPCEFHYD